MGFRWRIRVFPGVRLNLSKRGVSTSVGVGPLSVNFSKRGVTSTAFIPGTGLSYVHRHKGKRERQSDAPPQLRSMVEADTVQSSNMGGIWVIISTLVVGMLIAGWILIRVAPLTSQQAGGTPATVRAGASSTTPTPLPPRRPDRPPG
jgi:hypothetical protein